MPIGRHFMLGFRGTQIPTWLRRYADRYELGAVILFDYDVQTKKYGNNITSPDQLRELCREIHSLKGNPWVAVDQEGGKVRRLKESLGFQPLPGHEQFAKEEITDKRELLTKSFSEMKALGVDLNLAPVVDINFNPQNPDIGAIGRSFSERPEVVKENARLFFEAGELTGLGLCLKHYPGLGGATTNSHEALTDLSQEVRESQIMLFNELLSERPGRAVLLSHGLVKQWDKVNPVSVSAAAIMRLRQKAPEAILISDDLQMQGLQKLMSSEEASRRGLLAGLDLIIIGNNLFNEEAACEAIAETLTREANGDATFRSRLAQSAERLEKVRRKGLR